MAGYLDGLPSARAEELAVRHHLAWHELDALRAHALLDQAEGIDRGWVLGGSADVGAAGWGGPDQDARHSYTYKQNRSDSMY